MFISTISLLRCDNQNYTQYFKHVQELNVKIGISCPNMHHFTLVYTELHFLFGCSLTQFGEVLSEPFITFFWFLLPWIVWYHLQTWPPGCLLQFWIIFEKVRSLGNPTSFFHSLWKTIHQFPFYASCSLTTYQSIKGLELLFHDYCILGEPLVTDSIKPSCHHGSTWTCTNSTTNVSLPWGDLKMLKLHCRIQWNPLWWHCIDAQGVI